MYNPPMPHPSSIPFPDAEHYNEIAFDTLPRTDPFFLHQIVVDAYGAQHATMDSKPIGPAFALMGLCLFLEHGYTGKQVQDAHSLLAQKSKQWPHFDPPEKRGHMTAADVAKVPRGAQRDTAIKEWARVVWESWEKDHDQVRALLRTFLGV